MLWIDWLNNVRDERGVIGHLIAGPVPKGATAVYILQTHDGRREVDYKDILIQRQKGAEAKHYRGETNA